MIETLWKRHYHPGVTGSYHGDMARAFKAMLADPDCDDRARESVVRAIRKHKQLEATTPDLPGGKCFSELFPEI